MCIYDGRDYTAFASVPAAFRFRASLGEDNIYLYITSLARWAGATTLQHWTKSGLGFVIKFRILCGANLVT